MPLPALHIARLPFPLRLALLLGWAALLAWLSLAPVVPVPPGPLGWDKLDHALAYALLTLLLLAVLGGHGGLPGRLRLAGGALLAFAYGLLLESLQWVMALGRSWEAADLLANALGVLAACVIACRMATADSPYDD